MLTLIGAITSAKWLVHYFGWDTYEYHVLIEWIVTAVLITLEEDVDAN